MRPSRHPQASRLRALLPAFAAALLAAQAPAVADAQPAEPVGREGGAIRFTPGGVRVGLGGVSRPGGWTPLRVTLENPTAADADLTLSWTLPDASGDRAAMRRRLVVPAGREATTWLYGVLPPGTPGGRPGGAAGGSLVSRGSEGFGGSGGAGGSPVVATDDRGRVVAAATAVPDPGRALAAGEEAILVMSGGDLGLGDYARHAASHAERRLVRGLGLADLPDRPQGLLAVSAIVWAADGGGDPAAAGVPAAALSGWVRRGGHLVVVLPRVGQTWTQSPLAPLLPLPAGYEPRRAAVELPTLGVNRPEGSDAAPAWVLAEGAPADGIAVLLRSGGGEPLVTTVRRGFGAVTLVGLDLSAPLYRDASLPSGLRRFWNDVFGWSDPAVSERREANLRGTAAGTPPELKPARELTEVGVGGWVGRSLGLAGGVTAALTAALAVLVLLPVAAAAAWLLARGRGGGDPPKTLEKVPGGIGGPVRWAWPAFAAVCVVGAALVWAIAWAGRPEGPSARHQSVVDLDPAQGLRHARSRVSLFVPGFGRAAVGVGGAPGASAPSALGAAGSTLLSTDGLPGSAGAGFLDPQTYALDAAEPDAAELPLRSTTRPLRLDRLDLGVDPAARRVRLTGPAVHRAGTGRLRASLESSLPADLRDVLVVYCPGEGFVAGRREPLPPLAWRHDAGVAGVPRGAWPAGSTLEIDGVPERAVPLVEVPPLGAGAIGFRAGGWLNAVLTQAGVNAATGPQAGATLDDPVRSGEALSFFGRLPPPDVAVTAPPHGGVLRRDLPELVGLDLSALTSAPRLFVLGSAEGVPLPVPLAVNGVEPPSTGRTLYRVVVDLLPEDRRTPGPGPR